MSPTPNRNLLNILDQAKIERAFEKQREVNADRAAAEVMASPALQPNKSGLPFFELDFYLGATGEFGASGEKVVPINVQGYKFIFLREGSTPGARLDVFSNGTKLGRVGPGSVIKAPFNGLQLALSIQNAFPGRARIRIVTDPDADFAEPPLLDDAATVSAKLLGDIDTATYVQVAENTQPTTPLFRETGSFYATNFKKLRIFLKATNLESVELYPWVVFGGHNTGSPADVWFENGAAGPIVVPAPAAGGAYDTRVLLVDLAPYGWSDGNHLARGKAYMGMFFEVRNLLPAGLTELGMIVEGLR